jgi:hypothetical protein
MKVAGLGDTLVSVGKKLEGQKRVSARGYSLLHLTAPASSTTVQLCKNSEHRYACTYRVPHTTGVPDIHFHESHAYNPPSVE